MPITYLAHQVPVLAGERARRHGWDATAAAVGSMSPDWMYAFGRLQPLRSHELAGLLLFDLPVSVVVAVVLRRWLAPNLFAHLPDAGALRVRSFAVITRRRVALWATTASALAGAASHLVLDAFTHEGRWKVADVGQFTTTLPLLGHRYLLADVLQNGGSVVGSVLAVAMLWRLGRHRVLEARYGDGAVRAARHVELFVGQRALFWGLAALGGAWGAAFGSWADAKPMFSVPPAVFAGMAVAAVLPACRPRRVTRSGLRSPTLRPARPT